MMEIELQFLDWLQRLHTSAGNVFFTFITRFGDAGIFWILLGVVLLIVPKTRKSGGILLLSLLIEVILCNAILKNAFHRIRPFDVNTSVHLLIRKPLDFSFPSGHTAASFAAVAALFFAKEGTIWKPALILALLIAFSRMYLYVHYPTDILGGILIGTLCGYLGCKIMERTVVWWQNR